MFTSFSSTTTYIGSAIGHYDLSMALLTSDLATAPAAVDVGSPLVVAVHFNGPDALSLVVNNCWVAPNDDPDTKLFLLQDGWVFMLIYCMEFQCNLKHVSHSEFAFTHFLP